MPHHDDAERRRKLDEQRKRFPTFLFTFEPEAGELHVYSAFKMDGWPLVMSLATWLRLKGARR